MRIAFFDAIPWDYIVDSAWREPLGGTQSAICYLAAALVDSGHEVFLLNQTSHQTVSHGVDCIPLKEVLQGSTFQNLEFDVVVVSNSGKNGRVVKDVLGDKTAVILWTGHADDQDSIQMVGDPMFRDAYDGFAFVSRWQRSAYIRKFSLDSSKCHILRNAISPAFERAFAPDESILASKKVPPVLAYTSTPFRGLDLLANTFPDIRQRVPGIRLKVFSSMKLYNFTNEEDEKSFGDLYRLCQETEGIDYIGALPQPELVTQMREVTALAYPNTYPETSCIAVMEAMASGCFVVTSAMGALPETTAGFAKLIPITNSPQKYLSTFMEQCVTAIEQTHREDAKETEVLLRRQIDYCNKEYTWSYRAEEWTAWLEELCS